MRIDPLSKATKSLVKKTDGGFHIKPKSPIITTRHFTSAPVDDAIEAKRYNLQKDVDYYGARALDPVDL